MRRKKPKPATMQRRWRDYRTSAGGRPVAEFLDRLSDEDAAQVYAAMREIRERGVRAARHLEGDIYEVRADGAQETFRILFAPEGEKGQVLLSLSGFSKKTQKTPPREISLARRRLQSWRSRSREA